MTISDQYAKRVRPDIERAFAHIASGGVEPGNLSEDPIAAMRRAVNSYGAVDPLPPPTGVVILPADADGIACEWIVPDNDDHTHRLVYLHGGGWVAGGLESHRLIVAELAVAANLPILLVDYRLAPEHPFPAGLEDCEAAFAWAADNGPLGPSTATRLDLAGDSAGGNLTAALCQLAIINGTRIPDRLVLISAVLDGALNPARGQAQHVDANEEGLELVIENYLCGSTSIEDHRVSPMNATDEVLSVFPPCLLQASSAEYLLWDSVAFAQRLARVDARVVLSIWPSLPHVWQAFLELLPEARLALHEIADFLRSDSPNCPPHQNAGVR